MKRTCGLSKSAIAIILFNAVVGASNAFMLNACIWLGYDAGSLSLIVVLLYSLLAITTLFYPVSGFLADVCCGRFSVVKTGIDFIFSAFLLLSVCAVITMIFRKSVLNYQDNRGTFILLVVLAAVWYLLFVIGLALYRANYIQFGLDQLLEAPSKSLALFIHWVIWGETFGILFVQILFTVTLCSMSSTNATYGLGSMELFLTVCFFFVLLFLRRRWFYSEPGSNNPYKTVFKVLNFARKHKYPLQRSAFTYADDEEPTRIDFAKERYGGPFTTEQVEDVKTLFRILVVLLALGPVFVLEIPSSSFMSIAFGSHARSNISRFLSTRTCGAHVSVLHSSYTRYIVTVITFPVYMKVVFSILYRCVPKIFSRLVFAAIVYVLGIASMLCIDLTGHIIRHRNDVNGSMCMFIVSHDTLTHGLHLPSTVLVIPGLLLGLGSPLVMATTFEFISAQSPSSMKGLLVGVFFTIKAFFQLVSGVALVPFTVKSVWASQSMIDHPPVTNCGFGYLLLSCVVAVIGVVLLSVAVKKYKYRERDDRPYDQRFVVDVYSRYLQA